ncbi:uncharacterized protein BDR25DRAFT_346238 [Lindgomyces ingoldianus]|uniref:Uncharacterized protein n=1 Tax=Lindgomyces ingoldianus TaxID=673940 RepID=A0ACB6QEM9_9PLEO|nr:uncharacterized protein BDR25DRAFT_346238 [Lindgomyces ingoldianus]KAF2465369.1 hypothetical protein BDR25DRAFT_346238 [Lindgomyces ingoldianus]
MSDDILHSQTSQPRVQKSGSMSHSGSVSGASGSPNPRSCVTCRKRKVKCDKKQPCSNCARAKIECVFPGPGRAPRKSRKPPDGELMDRLRRLEGVVKTLNAQVEEHELEKEGEQRSRQGSMSMCPNGSRESPSVAVDNSVEGLESRFGRLVVDQGRSRYINNSFWASLNNEVEDLKAILIEPSDYEDESHDSPESSNFSSQHQSFIFGYSSTSVDMLALHPTPERAREFWEVYKENVDPLVKVLHVPSTEPMLLDAMTHPEKVPKGVECLMFSIYYGAVTSIMPQECLEKWGEERSSLLEKYRFALEQALARANFLYCDETIILQAFVIFLNIIRRNDDARKIWTLTGLVVRIAQTLGIHRDGSHFGLPPFEIEMRRRLWWQVCILDARASEDHGCDPTIVEAQFDTKMPLNVNDKDLDPDMTDFPPERVGFTDMTFCIIRFEVANIFRRILYIPPGPNRCNYFFANLTIPEKEKWISECHQRLEDKYLKDCDMSVPLYWVTATVSRLVMSKMWLIVYHPHQRRDGGASLPQETKDKLFITSLENIEYSILLETEARTMKWGWLFRTYVQWHAIAFLLSELCVRTKGEAVERAWRALEATAGRWWFPLRDSNSRKGKQGCLWKPLRKLMAKARAARERELTLERASQALKNGGLMYQDFPQLLDQVQEPIPTDQPNSEDLDKLLRPTAPRLGDMPVAKPPSWAGSPRNGNPQSPFMNGGNELLGFGKSTQSGSSMNGASMSGPSNSNPGQMFQDMTEYGFDYLMRDIWHDHNWEDSAPNMTNDSGRMMPHSLPSAPVPETETATSTTTTNRNPTTNTNARLPTAMDGISSNAFTQSPATLAASDFNNSPAGMGGSSGQSSDSPNLDGGQMDWANWDDLVREYGMDGAQGQMVANGAGHMGMVNWF